jgi:hypothetical protein
MMMQDLFLNLPIILHEVGSDSCEDFFSLLKQHVKNKHNLYIGETIEQTSHIGRTKQRKFEEDGPLFMESRRQNVFWWEGNVACCFANLSNYDSVSNRTLKQVWLVGFKETQNKVLDVEMKEALLSHDKGENPWTSSFTNSRDIFVLWKSMKMLM